MTTLRILRLADVVEKTGLTKTAIYNRMRKGEFPKNFPIGGCTRTVGWLQEDIDQYIKDSVTTLDDGTWGDLRPSIGARSLQQ